MQTLVVARKSATVRWLLAVQRSFTSIAGEKLEPASTFAKIVERFRYASIIEAKLKGNHFRSIAFRPKVMVGNSHVYSE